MLRGRAFICFYGVGILQVLSHRYVGVGAVRVGVVGGFGFVYLSVLCSVYDFTRRRDVPIPGPRRLG